MNNKLFSQQLEKRTKGFSISVIKVVSQLSNSIERRIIKNQIIKSSTSVGANYREANRARSKADFKNKIKICESEASETLYWLEIIQELKWLDEKTVLDLIEECKELLAIYSTIGKNLI